MVKESSHWLDNMKAKIQMQTVKMVEVRNS